MPLVNVNDDDDEVKGDMTPMIDIIFLLLIFFILTTKFVPNEKAISNLMPTDKGQAASSPPVVEPPEDINIRIWPAGMGRGGQPSEYDAQWIKMLDSGEAGKQAVYQIGAGSQLLVDGSRFSTAHRVISKEIELGEVAKIHRYINEALEAREKPGSRKDQDPVVIHCFSGMPWKYALIAYDAIRYFEGTRTGEAAGSDALALQAAREVNFAPPRIRNYHTWERGNEIFEIMNLR